MLKKLPGIKQNNIFSAIFSVLMLSSIGCGGGSDPVDPPVIVNPPAPELPPVVADVVDVTEVNSGGSATIDRQDEDAYSQSAPAITSNFELDANFKAGNQLFRNTHQGQGPILNTATCQGCHIKDGRGHVPSSVDEPMDAMLVKVSGADGQNEQTYGGQFQTFGLASFEGNDPEAGLPRHDGAILGDGAIGEAFAYIVYEEVEGQYPDGETFSLRKPTYRLKNLSYGPLSNGVTFSPRIAPAIYGLGLIGAIAEEDIKALADPDDVDNDGVSGRFNQSGALVSGEIKLGRFGSKALTTSVLHQSVGAYRGDMGISNQFFPDEPCTDLQQACLDVADQELNNGENGTDISSVELALVEFYARTLAVPKRRGFDSTTNTWESDIWQGRQLFFQANCVACHTPRHETSEASGSILGEVRLNTLEPDAEPIEALSQQIIWPYSDMLLHDMGGSCDAVVQELISGESCEHSEQCEYVLRCDGLADGRVEGEASGSEWRTPPLWGIGLVKTVNPRASFLHDGRARTIQEAILWHGGEAEASRSAFMNLSLMERDAVIAFLESM